MVDRARPGRDARGVLADVAPSDHRGARRAGRRDARRDRLRPPAVRPARRAQFNDFTKIHFWKYRRLDAERARRRRGSWPGSRTATPPSSRKPLGKGRLVVLASGWNPADSQLARSSKFVPLMIGAAGSARPAARSTAEDHASATACRCRPRTRRSKAAGRPQAGRGRS